MKKFIAAALMVVLGSGAYAQSEADLKEMSATIINLNGYLCARVISITPTSTSDVWRVSCVENRDGTGRALYLMNAVTASVSRG